MTWNRAHLKHCSATKYLSVTLDRALSYEQNSMNTKSKVSGKNGLGRLPWRTRQVSIRQISTRLTCRYRTERNLQTYYGMSQNDKGGQIAASNLHCIPPPPRFRREQKSMPSNTSDQHTKVHSRNKFLRAIENHMDFWNIFYVLLLYFVFVVFCTFISIHSPSLSLYEYCNE